jgi:hypothetical protein
MSITAEKNSSRPAAVFDLDDWSLATGGTREGGISTDSRFMPRT